MLDVVGVTAGYGDVTVLRGVDLTVPSGSAVALIGPNGAGKTTLLRVASGLLPPGAGKVVVDGVDATRWAPHRLLDAGVCHVPEGRGIFPSLTVAEHLKLFAPPGAEDGGVERAVAAFPRLGARLAQVAGTLSGGEQQMLALARVYLRRPRVVLLDEVSMGLAPRVVNEIYEFVGRLRDEGVSLLLVEQYITKALAVADYVYVLSRGRVAFAGEPAELNNEEIFARYLAQPQVARRERSKL